jgi:hypothetical protein
MRPVGSWPQGNLGALQRRRQSVFRKRVTSVPQSAGAGAFSIPKYRRPPAPTPGERIGPSLPSRASCQPDASVSEFGALRSHHRWQLQVRSRLWASSSLDPCLAVFGRTANLRNVGKLRKRWRELVENRFVILRKSLLSAVAVSGLTTCCVGDEVSNLQSRLVSRFRHEAMFGRRDMVALLKSEFAEMTLRERVAAVGTFKNHSHRVASDSGYEAVDVLFEHAEDGRHIVPA